MSIMNKAIILHGMPSKEEYFSSVTSPSNSHWIAWLQNKLLQNNILVQTPEMITPYEPEYNKWEETISHFKIDENTILVGHSCGAGFFLKYLSQQRKQFKHLFLIAPWIDPSDELKNDFFQGIFESKIDGAKITIFYSTDDESTILRSVEEIKKNYTDSKYISYDNKGHFCFSDLNSNEFPELLDEVLKK